MEVQKSNRLGIDPNQVYPLKRVVWKKFFPYAETQFYANLWDAVERGLVDPPFPLMPGARALAMTGAQVLKLDELRQADAAVRARKHLRRRK
jgi:hypothetical protein